MKYAAMSLICVAVTLMGCATVKGGMTLKDGSKGFIATCGGTSGTWSSCYESANKECPKGFENVEQEQFVHEGFVKRNLYFRCK